MPTPEKPKSIIGQLAANTVLFEQLGQAASDTFQQRGFMWRSIAQRVSQLFGSIS
jgi:hypothetical protein